MNDRLSVGLVTLFYYLKSRKQRLKPIFLLAIAIMGIGFSPMPTALALSNSQQTGDGKAITTKAAPALETQPIKQAPAADVTEASRWNAGIGDLFAAGGVAGKVAEKEGLDPPQDKTLKSRELVGRRTENSTVRLNTDGTATQTVYSSPHFYKSGNSWEKIDTKLIEDSNVTATNPLGTITDVIQSFFKGPETYRMSANDWQARFTPSNSDVGMVRLEKGDETVSFKPVDAATVAPTVTTDETGRQTVTYKDLWPNIDVEYQIRSNQLKEFVVLKSADAQSDYSFTVDGAKLTADQKNPGAFKLEGDLADKFEVAPLSVTLMKRGVISEQVATQSFEDGQLKVRIDSDWLKSLPQENFPAVVDPTFTNGLSTNYEAYKSDGYGCNASTCYLNAGSINDGGTWKNWRGEARFSYSALQGKKLKSATVHLQQMPQTSGKYYGTYNTYNYALAHASCHGYNCIDTSMARPTISMNTSGNFNVTSIYQNLMNIGDWGGWLMVYGQEGTTETVKMFDPDNTYATFDYYVTPTAPTVTIPSNGQTFTDPQVSLKVNKMANPNSSSTPLRYEFKVTTGSDGQTGTIIDSGYVNATQWTVPDGVLQDGSTYYLTTYSYDPVYGVKSAASAVRSFKIDTRQGKDKTQTTDTVGPVSIDLATGNVSTSASSHTSKALGGNLGVSLDYNSPVKSRPGLVGEYWNVASGYTGGIPTTAADMSRVDQAVDFDWDTGSPGGNINNDWYMARWTGYFVAPTAGTYYFGGVHDDALTITVNGQQVYTNTICGTAPCYGSAITLSAGQVATFKAEYGEGGVQANAHIYVKGAVSEQIVPQKWFQTGVRPVAGTHGLTGRFYKDDGGHSVPTDTSTAFLTRTDSLLSFDWGSGSPVPNGAADNFIARWTGYITVPATGTYQFGTISDDGSRVTVNGTQVYSNWQDSGAVEGYGTGITLTADQSVPITVDYYEHTGGAQLYLKVQGAVDNQVVPSSWLSPNAQVLPDGWNLGVDADGSASYDHINVSQNSVTLSDSTGSTHEYLWTGTGYQPPVNEDGQLTRNTDGTFTLIDTDGRTYVFGQDGYLQSLTSPSDDKQPTALQYTYSGTPAKITKITDGVDANRYAAVYYSGDSHCVSAPSGFQASAPANMLCAVQTNDGRTTSFFYKDNYLSRIVQPGNVATDYQYDTLGRLVSVRDDTASDAVNAGIRSADATVLTEITYDAIGRATGVTQPAATTGASRQAQTFEYLPGALDGSYAGITREHVTGAAEPNGYSRSVKYDDLFRTVSDTDAQGLTDTTVWDSVKDLALSSTDEKGLTTTTIYDDDDRPVSQYGAAPSSWFGADRKPLSTYAAQVPRTDTNYDEAMTGLAVTYNTTTLPGVQDTLANGQTIYKGQSRWSADGRYQFTYQTDGNIVLYDPNGTALWHTHTTGQASTKLVLQGDGNLVLYNNTTPIWYTSSLGGSSSHLVIQDDGNAVIYTTTGYSWQSNTGLHALAGTSPTTLAGAPFWHSTNIGSSTSMQISNNFGTSSPNSSITSNWGMTMTGKMRLPSTGSYSFRINSDNGVRVWIDDVLVLDDWVMNAAIRNHPTFTYDNTTANVPHRIKIQYFHVTGTATFGMYMTPPGGSETANVAMYFSPDYSLSTSSTSYDSTIGNTTTTTGYGSRPELGQASSTTVDGAGANLTNTSTYEPYNTAGSYLRQTNSSLPGGATTNYTYYGATETRDNPCTSGTTEAYRQGGMAKITTDPDPDGAGSQAGITTENVYDDAGNVVATRTNSDGWTCTTYDARGQVTQTDIPSFNGKPARTITYNYAVNGNPLVTSKADASGTITTTTDLLGRTVGYTDAHGNTTTTTYDSLGRVSSDTGPLGAQIYAYNDYDQLTSQKVDGQVVATPSYDQYGRLNQVSYPSAGITETISFDVLGNTASQSYTLLDSSVISDAATYSQSNQVLTDTTSTGSGAKTWTYTYDKANRLTGAADGTNTYGYGFGAQNASCATGTNANAGKDSNRTSLTKNGQTTTYCYDYADRLVSSSDQMVDAAQYDGHGNTVSLGTTGHQTTFEYDSSDRNTKVTEGSKSTAYVRDATDRVIARTTNDGSVNTTTRYGFTSGSDSPDVTTDGSNNVIEKFLSLPGDVQLTIHPASTSASYLTASLSNLHGDTIATVNADNAVTGTFNYDPFGGLVSSTVPALLNNSQPNNTVNGGTFGAKGQSQKETEVNFTLQPTQMGVRVYIAGLGRFLQTDPVPGGTPNGYVYPTDPINQEDLNGMWSFGWFQPTMIATPKNNQRTVDVFKWLWQKRNQFVAWKDKHMPWLNDAVSVLAMTRGGKGGIKIKGGELKIGKLRVSPGSGKYSSDGTIKKWAARLPHWHFKTDRWGGSRHRPWQTTFKKWFK